MVDLSRSKFEYTTKINYCDLYSIITIDDIWSVCKDTLLAAREIWSTRFVWTQKTHTQHTHQNPHHLNPDSGVLHNAYTILQNPNLFTHKLPSCYRCTYYHSIHTPTYTFDWKTDLKDPTLLMISCSTLEVFFPLLRGYCILHFH